MVSLNAIEYTVNMLNKRKWDMVNKFALTKLNSNDGIVSLRNSSALSRHKFLDGGSI